MHPVFIYKRKRTSKFEITLLAFRHLFLHSIPNKRFLTSCRILEAGKVINNKFLLVLFCKKNINLLFSCSSLTFVDNFSLLHPRYLEMNSHDRSTIKVPFSSYDVRNPNKGPYNGYSVLTSKKHGNIARHVVHIGRSVGVAYRYLVNVVIITQVLLDVGGCFKCI